MTYPEFYELWKSTDIPWINRIKQGGVKALRQKAGMSQQKFSDVYGIPRRSIQNWEATPPAYHSDIPDHTFSMLAYMVLYASTDRDALYLILREESTIEASYSKENAIKRMKELREEGFPEAYVSEYDLDTDVPASVNTIPYIDYYVSDDGKMVKRETWDNI